MIASRSGVKERTSGFWPLSLCALVMFALPAYPSDYAKEQRWAEQIVDSLLDGDAEYLAAGNNEFLSIYTRPDTESTRGAVIMHGSGVHPDWQTVIYPLRVELAGHGLHTLSIQMPVLANDAEQAQYVPLFEEVAPRIDAAVSYLQAQGIDEVYLIGHSLGAAMTAYYLRDGGAGVNGFVAVGMSPGIADTAMDNHANLATITVPTLDLYGSDDLPEVVAGAADRRNAAKNNPSFVQRLSQGADHFFDGEEDALVKTVAEWILK